MKFRLICIASFAILLAAVNVAGVRAELVVWDTGGYGEDSVGYALGNGGADNGVCTQLGYDERNTLTITAAGSSETQDPIDPDCGIAGSTQNGITVRAHGGDQWLSDGEWFDLVFTLAGPDAGTRTITLVMSSLPWFNDGGDNGENLDLFLDPDGANTLLGSAGYGDIDPENGMVYTSINIPLEQEIRFNVRNTQAANGWPDNQWVIRQMMFEVVAMPGDANGDLKVDGADAAILAAHWQTVGGMDWNDGDFNDDNNVDDIDATMMAANWGWEYGVPDASAVPEPSVLAVLCGLLLGGFIVRRRRTY